MTAVQLKSRLIELIQKEGDMGLLKLLDKLLDHSSGESAYRAMLADGADLSEADIKAGRVHSLDEAKAEYRQMHRRS